MTEIILNFLNKKEDLILLSKAYKKGEIQLNISKKIFLSQRIFYLLWVNNKNTV